MHRVLGLLTKNTVMRSNKGTIATAVGNHYESDARLQESVCDNLEGGRILASQRVTTSSDM